MPTDAVDPADFAVRRLARIGHDIRLSALSIAVSLSEGDADGAIAAGDSAEDLRALAACLDDAAAPCPPGSAVTRSS